MPDTAVNVGRVLPSGDGPVDEPAAQGEKKEEALGQTLSKSQITALAALCITDIDLLRRHLDGDDSTRLYDFILGLICTSLTLQFLSGIITITVMHSRSYFHKHAEERTLADCCRMYCALAVTFSSASSPSAASGSSADPGSSSAFPPAKCCLCFTRRIHPDYEYVTIDRYNKWCLDAVNVNVNPAALGAGATPSPVGGATPAPVGGATPAPAAEHTVAFMKEGETLRAAVTNIYKDRTMRKATFWLNTVNYILYLITFIHALVLGLGAFTQ